MSVNLTREAIAYHEAGHAVMAYLKGRRFKVVTIEPDEDSSGHVSFYDGRIVKVILEGTHCCIWLMEHPEKEREIVWRDILCNIAGHIAQDIGVPGSVEDYQWEADREALINRLSSSPEGAECGWDRADAEVREALKQNWQMVNALASRLLESKTLSGREAWHLLDGVKSYS